MDSHYGYFGFNITDNQQKEIEQKMKTKLATTAIIISVFLFGLVAGVQVVEVAMANPILVVLPLITIRNDGSIEGSLYPIPMTKTDNTYTLTDNIVGFGLDILCNNVTVDGAGFSLKGTERYNDNSGITIQANGVTIINFNISHYDWAGINITGSYNTIIGNNASAVLNFGIFIEGNYNNVSRNTLSSPNYALWLTSLSSNNNLTQNTLYDTVSCLGKGNLFYLNNFLKSSFAISIPTDKSQVNFFDNGTVGNYWINYNGTDVNDDGIGNIAYVIDSNQLDRYPLMLPSHMINNAMVFPTPSLSPTIIPKLIELPYAAGNFSPTPNSTNVPLNTTISISFGRPPSICDLNITPNVPIEERKFGSEGFGRTYIFRLAEPLQPQTTYTATITFGQETASEGFAPTSTRTWNFTTLPQPQQPTLEPSPTSENILVEDFTPTIIIIGLVAAAVAVGVLVFFKKRR
jgi:hypothetical protein